MQRAPSGGQICNWCKWCHLVAKFGTNASQRRWPFLVAPSGGQICNSCKWRVLKPHLLPSQSWPTIPSEWYLVVKLPVQVPRGTNIWLFPAVRTILCFKMSNIWYRRQITSFYPRASHDSNLNCVKRWPWLILILAYNSELSFWWTQTSPTSKPPQVR